MNWSRAHYWRGYGILIEYLKYVQFNTTLFSCNFFNFILAFKLFSSSDWPLSNFSFISLYVFKINYSMFRIFHHNVQTCSDLSILDFFFNFIMLCNNAKYHEEICNKSLTMTKFAYNALKNFKIRENDYFDDYKVTTRTARAKLAVKNCL